MRQTNHTALSEACTYLAVALGVFALMTWAVDVAPWQRESFRALCLRSSVLTLSLASLAAVFRGIVRAKQPPQKTARWKRIAVRAVFWMLIPLGAIALSEGHVYHVKAKQLDAQQEEIVARTGYYHNPYWDRQTLCDLLGYACFGGWVLWTWLAIVAQASEDAALLVVRRKANVSGNVGVLVWTIVRIALALAGLGMIIFAWWWSRDFT